MWLILSELFFFLKSWKKLFPEVQALQNVARKDIKRCPCSTILQHTEFYFNAIAVLCFKHSLSNLHPIWKKNNKYCLSTLLFLCLPQHVCYFSISARRPWNLPFSHQLPIGVSQAILRFYIGERWYTERASITLYLLIYFLVLLCCYLTGTVPSGNLAWHVHSTIKSMVLIYKI